jgi:hypothetical protein
LAIGKYESRKNSRILLHFGYLLETVVEFWQFRIYLFSLKVGELGPFCFKKTPLYVSKSFFFSIFKVQPPKNYGYELLENLKRLMRNSPK